MNESENAPLSATAKSSLRWSGIIAGTAAASALSFVLLSFAAAIGLSVASASPTWRDASVLLWILSGIFLIFVALASFGLGGYIAGRMHPSAEAASVEEREFRDGLHGVIMWGLAILIGAVLSLGTAAALLPGTGPQASSSSGEVLLADELDRLFRTSRIAADADLQFRRAEASRILMTVSSDDGMTAEDRTYLSALVANRAGVDQATAEQRVNDAAYWADLAISRARAAAAIQAFAISAALLLGAVAAWFAAVEGGRDREKRSSPAWSWNPWRNDRPRHTAV